MAERKYASIVQAAVRFEEIVLGLLLSSMILLACLQIVLRSLFASGLLWADPLLRYLVLWSGLLGASMATSRGSHIAIDLAAYLIPKQLQPLVQLLCHLFSAITSGVLSWASVLFISSEIEFGSPGLLDIPSWGWNLIFPLAFMLITLRYLVLFITTAIGLLRRQHNAPGDQK
jgi:TRAP-type C4-dicarboxylate transport system permease small subunit